MAGCLIELVQQIGEFILNYSGRKPLLVIGVAGSTLSSIFFGFSWNYASAISARALNGLLNGNIGVAKSYLGAVAETLFCLLLKHSRGAYR